ncbi:MAG: MFS transporter [Pseudomonadota bacterium]
MTERSALRNRNFQIYFAGAVISLHGLWIFRVALAWYAWQLTGSESWVGVIAFSQFAPALFFGPLFGVIADRVERRKLSMLVNSGSALNMVVLTLLTVTGNLSIEALAAVSLVQGMLEGAHTPVRMALVPGIVSREELGSAIASNSIAFNISRVVGPAISGFIIVTYGVATAFIINGISYAAIVIAVGIIDIQPRKERGSGPTDIWSQLMEGIDYIRQHTLLRAIMIAITINTLFGRGVLEMMPAVADGILQRGSGGLAIMTSAVGAGAVLTGLALARGTRWLGMRALKTAIIASAVLIVLFGYSTNFVLSVITVSLLGVVLSLGGVGSQILIQSNVDDEVRGRVSSIWGMIAFGGTAFGGLAIGVVADLVGLTPTLIVTGVLCLAAAVLLPVPAGSSVQSRA